MIFIKKFQIKKKISFYFITFNFLMLLLLHKTLKGSRNIQGFALIRAVLSWIVIQNFLKVSNFLLAASWRNQSYFINYLFSG